MDVFQAQVLHRSDRNKSASGRDNPITECT
jgi:hypothetical protein